MHRFCSACIRRKFPVLGSSVKCPKCSASLNHREPFRPDPTFTSIISKLRARQKEFTVKKATETMRSDGVDMDGYMNSVIIRPRSSVSSYHTPIKLTAGGIKLSRSPETMHLGNGSISSRSGTEYKPNGSADADRRKRSSLSAKEEDFGAEPLRKSPCLTFEYDGNKPSTSSAGYVPILPRPSGGALQMMGGLAAKSPSQHMRLVEIELDISKRT